MNKNKKNRLEKNIDKKEKETKTKKTKKNSDVTEKEKTNEFKIKEKNNTFKKVLYLIFFIVIMFGIYCGLSYIKWQKLAFLVLNNEASTVYNQKNEEIVKIGNERKQENVLYNEIPKHLINAYVSIEDQRYYTHYGIDIRRTASAILNHITKQRNSFGGSTITQQLVKNVTGNTDNTISRKVSEWVLALELETMLTKEEILEEYLNILYIAPNTYGVKLGAKYYFNKDLSELKLEECAYLAGINHTPNSYNPFNESDNTAKITKRTITVLDKMLELGYINEEEFNTAKSNTEKGLNFKKGNIKAQSDGIYSYHTDALLTELTKELQEKYNIKKEFAENIISMGNLKIYSTEITSVQTALEKEFSKSQYKLPATNEKNESSQAAMVVIDHANGYVTGIVGGIGKKDTARGLNRATQSYRQTGSAGKPIAVVAPALSEGYITAASMYLDELTTFNDNSKEGFSPVNYNSYRGNISVRQALESSQNIPFVKIIEEITPKKSIEYLKNFGITTLTEDDENLSLALGGLSKGISPIEMAAAYATIANNGKYIEPTFYTKVTSNGDSIIIKTSQETRKVLSKENAYILQDLLTEPVSGLYGTAQYCKINGISVAAKTGTTNDNFDKWLCGFTPYYTAATWFGYDYNEPIEYNKKNPAGIIWANVMNNIHRDLNEKTFNRPYTIEQLNICIETGCLANTGCKNTYTEYFTKDNLPNDCTIHEGEPLDKVDSAVRNTTQSYTISQNTVVQVIDDIKATWDEIKGNQDKIEEKTTQIINEIQKANSN